MSKPAQKNQIEFIARALILHQSHVLMCKPTKANYLYLPGGHIDFAEPASHALRRELMEEAAADITVGPLLLTTENTFNDGKKNHHELNLVFHVEQFNGLNLNSTPTQPPVESQESKIEFQWIDLASAADLDIRPAQIKAWLATGGQLEPATTNHPDHLPAHGLAQAPHLTEFELPIPT